ncbi:LysR family transcriptional regulator [Dyella subtropica]|uniref:LysR family transcriptional regulator n=1 Tax=Dyella subtropica TaxID=2992127 RepID=UPI00224D159B|nr:LysR family transcriptional regulator [Dyella subtropica]
MKSGDWSLDDLDLVRAIAANGSLAGAARELEVDHSNAFRRLGAIEARTGVTLFRRSRRGYEATEAGELASRAAERVLAETTQLSRELQGRDQRVQGLLRITAPDTLARHLVDLCTGFEARHPSVRFELVINNAFLTLQKRDADVAIRPARQSPPGLSVRKLAPIATAIYEAKSRRKAQSKERWIGLGDALSHLDAAQWIRNHVEPENIALVVDTLPAALAACEAGVGRALLPCFYAEPSDQLRRVSELLPDVQSQLWFATHPDLRTSTRIRLFRDFTLQWAKEHANDFWPAP